MMTSHKRRDWIQICISQLSKQDSFYYSIGIVVLSAAAAAKSLQSSPTLCDPIDGSPPGSPVPGILQARTLEWVAISFSNAWKWKVKAKPLSPVWLFTTPWTAAHQAPPSMGFSRQEYWSGMPLPSPSSTLYYTSKQLNLALTPFLKFLLEYSILCSFLSHISHYKILDIGYPVL